jgi:hypothetical protein
MEAIIYYFVAGTPMEECEESRVLRIWESPRKMKETETRQTKL